MIPETRKLTDQNTSFAIKENKSRCTMHKQSRNKNIRSVYFKHISRKERRHFYPPTRHYFLRPAIPRTAKKRNGRRPDKFGTLADESENIPWFTFFAVSAFGSYGGGRRVRVFLRVTVCSGEMNAFTEDGK